MKTSYYQNRRIDPAIHAVVQISNGFPRWGARPEFNLEVLFPPVLLVGAGLSREDFKRAYIAHLETIDLDSLKDALVEIEEACAHREPILCCFEALKKPGQFCHRSMFAEWYELKTGQIIPEL